MIKKVVLCKNCRHKIVKYYGTWWHCHKGVFGGYCTVVPSRNKDLDKRLPESMRECRCTKAEPTTE